jgi:hypothetical protein
MYGNVGRRLAVLGLILWVAILPLDMAASDVAGGSGGSCCQAPSSSDCCQDGEAASLGGCQCIVLPGATFLFTSSDFPHTKQSTPSFTVIANPSPLLFFSDIFHPPKAKAL